MTFFIEGIQGSGKSTLVQKLSEKHSECTPFREGDYSPVELAWCAYMDKEQYEHILSKYEAIRKDIEAKTVREGDGYIVCYTQIITDIEGFHKDLEKYEIYNGRRSYQEFESIILNRFTKWTGKNQIFECSIFQNIVEDMILFAMASDDEIIEFYKKIKNALRGKEYKIIYLKSDNLRDSIEIIKKERSDENGVELWFPIMCEYFNQAPYAKKTGLSGFDGLIKHLEHRQNLEIRLCNEVFTDNSEIWESKKYDIDYILKE